MKTINIYSKQDIEKIVETRIQKLFRLKNLEKAVDKLRLRVNDLDMLLQNLKSSGFNNIK